MEHSTANLSWVCVDVDFKLSSLKTRAYMQPGGNSSYEIALESIGHIGG